MNNFSHTTESTAALAPEIRAWCKVSLSAQSELSVAPLRVEASHRQFYRLQEPSRASWVLMLSPPELERNTQFLNLARVFAEHNVPVPQILAADEQRGWILMEDLGRVDLEQAYEHRRDEALTAAIDELARLSAVQHPLIETYDRARFAMELGIFDEWFTGALLADVAQPMQTLSCKELLLDTIIAQPKGCVHRDYHCRNLLFNQGQLGIVDFQDALRGPILYDIASLLRDCYFTFTETEIDRWFAYFLAKIPAARSIENPKRSFDFTAIQRQLKAIGIFARLHLRDSKSSHLPHILPVLQRLIALTAEYPELAPLHMQLNSCVESTAARLENL